MYLGGPVIPYSKSLMFSCLFSVDNLIDIQKKTKIQVPCTGDLMGSI